MHKYINIAIGIDITLWHEKFTSAFAKKKEQGFPIQYKVVDLETNDWLKSVKPCDVVILKSACMGPRATAQFQAKVYFLEAFLGKLVIPNFKTIWHFENKIAQSYIFEKYGVPTPKTTVSFNYHDAIRQIRSEKMPIVYKKPYGAGSQNVKLVKNILQAKRIIIKLFCYQLWKEARIRSASKTRFLLSNMSKRWFWAEVFRRLFRNERFKSVYWQRFIPGNEADLRITVIGDRYAFGFWRNNRPHDFRASGSGSIDYHRAIPEDPLRYCIEVNRNLGFDSMAYDILFTKDNFVITEISYGYLDSAIYNADGYYELQENRQMAFVKGHFWPQELWVEWAIERIKREL